MSALNILKYIVFINFLLISGCSQFFAREKEEYVQLIEVQLNASDHINPNVKGDAQPVKICVIETRKAGWSPSGLYNGRICSDLSVSQNIIAFSRYIIVPGHHETYQSYVNYQDTHSRWVVIGAEFQKGVNKYSVVEKRVSPGTHFNIEVRITGTELKILERNNGT